MMEHPLPSPAVWNSRPLNDGWSELVERFDTERSPELAPLRKAAAERWKEVGIPSPKHELFTYAHPTPLFQAIKKSGSLSSIPLCSATVTRNGNSEPETATGSPTPLDRSLPRLKECDDPISLAALTTLDTFPAFTLEEGDRLTLLPRLLESEEVAGYFCTVSVPARKSARLDLPPYSPVPTDRSTPAWGHLHIDVDLAEGAELSVSLLRTGDDTLFSTSSLTFRLAAESRLTLSGGWEGTRFERNRIDVRLDGAGAYAELNGVTSAGRKRQLHHLIDLRHNSPDCRSRQRFHQILRESSTVSVDGTVRVAPGADGTDSDQLIRSLLMSDDATAAGKPRLFIDADDVECRHGATHGSLEEEELFYLISRGLSPDRAAAALVRGFAAEILGTIPSDSIRAAAEATLFGAVPGEPLSRQGGVS